MKKLIFAAFITLGLATAVSATMTDVAPSASASSSDVMTMQADAAAPYAGRLLRPL